MFRSIPKGHPQIQTDANTRSTAQKKVKRGDVVLLKRASTGARYHAIFISKKSKGKAYYCGHTESHKDKEFDYIDVFHCVS